MEETPLLRQAVAGAEEFHYPDGLPVNSFASCKVPDCGVRRRAFKSGAKKLCHLIRHFLESINRRAILLLTGQIEGEAVWFFAFRR